MTTRRSFLAGGAVLAASPLLFSLRAKAADTVLRMGDQRGNVRAVMEAAGVLGDLPYNLVWSEFPAAAPLIEALNAGAIDAGNVGDAPFTFGFAAGVPMKAIATSRSTQQGTAILVRGDSPVRTLADLKGKKIATGRGSIGHFLILAALRRDGLADDFAKIVFLLPADAKAALAAGSIDAWSTWEPYTSQIEMLEGGRQVLNGQGLTPGLGYQIASDQAIAGKRAALEDFVTRLTVARRWADANPDKYAEFWAKLMGFPVAVPKSWFNRTKVLIVPADAAVIQGEQQVIDIYADAGLLTKRFDAAAAIDASFNAAIQKGNAKI
jgi:sulfonate transport system substrate-binding protein